MSRRTPEPHALQRRPFSDRYVFAKVMQDNPELCRDIVACILGLDVGRIRTIEVESERVAIERRGVRFDVFLQGEDAAFEVEMQTYEQQSLPLRMRYYRSQIDRRLLDKGEPFDALAPVYIIFICTHDPFGFGLPVYTFRGTCQEDPSVPFDNGATDIVLSAAGDLTRTTPEIAALLRYVRTGEVSGDALASRIEDAVDEAYRDEGWLDDMRLIDWDLRDARRAAEREGWATGHARGCAEGRAEGQAEGRANERRLQAGLVAAMEHEGHSADEILAALMNEDRDELYERYGLSS